MPFGFSFSLPPSDFQVRLQRSEQRFLHIQLHAAFKAFEENKPDLARSYIAHGINCTDTPEVFGVPMCLMETDQEKHFFSPLGYCVYIQDAGLCKQCLQRGADPLYQHQDAVVFPEGYPSALRQAAEAVENYLEEYETRCEDEGRAVAETDAEVAIFAVFSLLFGRAHGLLKAGKLSAAQPEYQKEREADYGYALETWNALPFCRYEPPYRVVLEPISEAIEDDDGEEITRSRRASSGTSHSSLAAGVEDPPGNLSDEEKTERASTPPPSAPALRTPDSIASPKTPEESKGLLDTVIRGIFSCCSPASFDSASPSKED